MANTSKIQNEEKLSSNDLRDTPEEDLAKIQEQANQVANQTIDEGNPHEVQGKLAVPRVEVIKRGQVKYTDEDGNLVKELTDAPLNDDAGETPKPDYIQLHEQVLAGADPLEATRNFDDKNKVVREGDIAEVEDSPRSQTLGAATTADNVQKEDTKSESSE